jgi:hypothetical protein
MSTKNKTTTKYFKTIKKLEKLALEAGIVITYWNKSFLEEMLGGEIDKNMMESIKDFVQTEADYSSVNDAIINNYKDVVSKK